MAITQNTFTGNGSNLGPFSFTFKWLESTDIKVTVAGVLKTVGTHYNLQNLNYTTKSGGQVLFTAGNAPANGAAIVIYRQTDDADLVSTFYSGSAIRAQDLNDNFTQNLYVTQEANNNVVTSNTTANTALSTANTALSNSTAAVATANTASTNASNAVNTANTASSNASAAVATANTASGNASAAVATANTASSNATTAVNTANATAAQFAILDANVYDKTELDGGQLDNRYYTETELNSGALDSQYFRQDSSETINSGMAWSGSDSYIATTKAIDARIVDLVDDVGGFVPIANENSFPASNPDINNPDGSGTIVSIKEISSTRTPSSGTVTIANGSGSNTVTINGCGSTVLAAGFGVLVETTSTLHTYTFHRLVPKATEVTTVASISGDVTAVAANSTNVTTVATNASSINSVAGNATNINAVNANSANINAVAGNALNINAVSANSVNINSVASNSANVNTVAGSIANVNTVASSIGSVNSFSNVYRIASSDPTTSLDVGDLVFNTTNKELRIYNGTAWQAGVTATGNLVSKSGDTMTGPLLVPLGTAALPALAVSGDPNTGLYSPGSDQLAFSTGGTGRLFVNSSGNVSVGSGPSDYKFYVVGPANGTAIAWTDFVNATGRLGTLSGGVVAIGGNTDHSFAIGGWNSSGTTFTERLRVDSSGRLGLGVSSPTYPLHIANGAVGITGVSNSVDGTSEVSLLLRGTNGANRSSILFSSSNTNVRAKQSFNPSDGSLRLDTCTDGSTFTERLVVTSGGRLGIGTNNPLTPLVISSSSENFEFSPGNSLYNGGVIEYRNRSTLSTRPDLNFYLDTGGGSHKFYTNNTERVRIDSSGRLLVGTTTARSNYESVNSAGLQVESAGGTLGKNISCTSNYNGAFGQANLIFAKTRGTAVGSTAAVQSGDNLGTVSFQGSDGTNFINAADITVAVDGTPGTNDMPGRLVFSTTSDGAVTPTERMRLDSSGRLAVGNSSPRSLVHIGTTHSATDIPVPAGNFLVVRGGGYNNITTAGIQLSSGFGDAGRIGAFNIKTIGAGSGSTFTTDLAISTQGSFSGAEVERLRIDSSGRLLVGTSSGYGNYRLQVEGNSTDSTGPASVYLRRGLSSAGVVAGGGTGLGLFNFGTNDGTIAGRIECLTDATWSGTSSTPGRLVFSTTSDGASSPTERVRITNAGAVLIGSTDPAVANAVGVKINNLGRIIAESAETQGGLWVNRITSDGNAAYFTRNNVLVGTISVTGSATAYNTSSDYRLKENVVPLTGAIDRLNDLQVRRFNFIADPDKTVDGFIAHEAQAVVPECVTGTKDEVDDDGNPVYQGIDQSKLVPLLTAALQEALQKIEDLEGRLSAAGL